MDRRSLLKLSGAAGASLTAGVGLGAYAASGKASAPIPLDLTIQSAQYPITATPTQGLVSLSPDQPPPVIRLRQGEPFAANVTNTLEEATAMHWHGIRLPNEMDGVPYLTQWPIMRGETWHYAYTSHDAGTYWYHPHCMTMDQMGYGLTGVLIVEEHQDPGFDGETILNLRDFRLGGDGQFIELYSARKAARGGTLGTVMTANWQQQPVYRHPPGALVRLRLAATDTTRIYRLALEGARGRIIAADGHPLREPLTWPTPKEPLVVAPGQRLDIGVIMPTTVGAEMVVSHITPSAKFPLATL
ncbi:MAG: multicopper oxidase family protein, partial [Pseudomonadota bacterium]